MNSINEELINEEHKRDIDAYSDVLEKSTGNLSSSINARLNESRRDAIASIDQSPPVASMFWRPALALLAPVMIVTVIMLNVSNEELAEADLYTDIELLIDEEELDFLTDLDISEWQVIDS